VPGVTLPAAAMLGCPGCQPVNFRRGLQQGGGIFMYKLPLVVIYAIVAFNITAFTLADLLLFQSLTIKIIASISTIVSWLLAYLNRNKFLRIG
jgi:hypothetical protein